MFSRVLRFVRLPLVLILIWAVLRFLQQPVFHTPYAPRGNAMFSVVGLTIISSIYFGALSRRVGGFNWGGTILCGVVIALWAQILVFGATMIDLAGHLNTYYTYWDSLGVKDGTPLSMSQVIVIRAIGLVVNIIIGGIAALIGRAVFSALAPKCHD